ncbi:MAG: hypothetical protein DMF95_11590 [Acidobacteria bacterium]|nr:MAG: hypothetical protein DMF94_21155 [Acidobacteriota bacterium]PYR49795.1 MAG: hypothetical protein DMF95_11590 [Acidobacteriota bacterium]
MNKIPLTEVSTELLAEMRERVGRKTEEVYRRYAIVDQAMIREAAITMNRGAKVRRTTAQRTAQSD